jgi:7-keto-8-aminopelargonate synthetase-like enzyme
MGTLSKALASCGGYVAGSATLIDYLKYTTGAFVFAAGIAPPQAAAALAALRQLGQRPELVARLQANAATFLQTCRQLGIDTGLSHDSAVVPCIVGDSVRCLLLAHRLRDRGIQVHPILYPAVDEDQARLRFFITADHDPTVLRDTAHILAEELARLM